MKVNQYFKNLEKAAKMEYSLAGEARKKGLDPVSVVEMELATSLPEKVVGIVSSFYPQIRESGISKRIIELEKEHASLDPAVALVIAEEVAKEKFCKFKSHKEALEAGVRIGVGYMTLGVVSSPIEGFVNLEIQETNDGKEYLVPYYAGPIRSAGGTEAAFSIVILDYLREIFGYSKYDPTDDEIKRGVHESYLYHERVTNLQYLPTEREIEFLMRNVPVQISGDPSERISVYNYKDLKRVKTNFIRSGFCLVLNEGLALKAPKIWGRIEKLRKKGFKLSDWDFVGEFSNLQKEIQNKKEGGADSGAVYIKDLVAGRPVFGHPSRSGGFRLRYGRSRNTGYSTLAVHPATMAVCGDFIAVGTQLKIEKPTKGCSVASCSEIDGPIVKMRNGDVIKLEEYDFAKVLYKEIEEIIYLGDLLIPYGDFMNRKHKLLKPGYNERRWLVELKELGGESSLYPDMDKALKFCKENGVPLHPNYIYFWTEIDEKKFLGLLDWIAHSSVRDGKLIFPFSERDRDRFSKGKRALEILGCPHKVSIENVVLNVVDTCALLTNLGIDLFNDMDLEIDKISKLWKEKHLKVFDFVKSLCEFKIENKAGTFIGSRMGRPEKAKLRKLTGSPHVLFPVGEEGGRLRSFQSALDVGSVKSEFPNFYCNGCKKSSVYGFCIFCNDRCVNNGGENELGFEKRRVDIRELFDEAKKKVGVVLDEIPLVKGVRGMSNKDHLCEYLGKGLLRAKHNLNVNKDGTIRYDMTEMPITHFKAKEIGVSIEKLREMGYEEDLNGEKLIDDNQVLEIFPHDVILPSCPNSEDEKAEDVFVRISRFIDDELEKIYGLERYFKAEKKEDVVGALLACISPHNCAAVLGRVIGFSKTQGFLASPYIHAAMRRDTDGDEAAVGLLMDFLLNFSKSYLPAHRGGTQDSPLVLNARIRAGEVDDMVFDLDVSKEISLDLYKSADEEKSPGDVKMDQVAGRLGGENEFNNLYFSYNTDDINSGATCSSYKTLPTMKEKVEAQMTLCKKIRAVDTGDVSRLIIERHFLRDTRGNLRKFSMQTFRCVGCNSKYRRTPLSGVCKKCGGKLIFTISEGSIMKYMQPALDLARKYKLSHYLLESLELTEMYIQSIFGKDPEKQESLRKWF